MQGSCLTLEGCVGVAILQVLCFAVLRVMRAPFFRDKQVDQVLLPSAPTSAYGVRSTLLYPSDSPRKLAEDLGVARPFPIVYRPVFSRAIQA